MVIACLSIVGMRYCMDSYCVGWVIGCLVGLLDGLDGESWVRLPQQPLDADLRPSNIIRADNGDLTVIDFDDAGYSWYLYDYASSLSFVEHKP